MLQINTVADAVAESINQKLINGEICPGNKINIDSLARELGVSKTPVREALKKLENTGILQALPRVGWRVPQTTIQETKWIFEFQRMLDLGLLGKIYDFKLLPNREKCEHINEEIKTCFINGNLDDVIKLNINFHMELIANADNKPMQETVLQLWRKATIHRTRIVNTSEFQKYTALEHSAIIHALFEGTKQDLEKVVYDHWIHGWEIWEKSYEENTYK